MPEMENSASQSIVIVLTANEVKFIRECVLGCPVQTNVTNMLPLLGLVQGILKKLAPLTAPTDTVPAGESPAAPKGI